MFVAKTNKNKDSITIYVSSYESGFTKFKRAVVPSNALLSSSFTIMDASENSVFMHI